MGRRGRRHRVVARGRSPLPRDPGGARLQRSSPRRAPVRSVRLLERPHLLAAVKQPGGMGRDGAASRGRCREREAHHGVRLGLLAAPAATLQPLGRPSNDEGDPPPRGRPMWPAHAQREEGDGVACAPHRAARRREEKRRAERRFKLFRFAIVAGFAILGSSAEKKGGFNLLPQFSSLPQHCCQFPGGVLAIKSPSLRLAAVASPRHKSKVPGTLMSCI